MTEVSTRRQTLQQPRIKEEDDFFLKAIKAKGFCQGKNR